MIVVGDSEEEGQSVSVRLRDGTNLGAISVSEFQNMANQTVTERTI